MNGPQPHVLDAVSRSMPHHCAINRANSISRPQVLNVVARWIAPIRIVPVLPYCKSSHAVRSHLRALECAACSLSVCIQNSKHTRRHRDHKPFAPEPVGWLRVGSVPCAAMPREPPMRSELRHHDGRELINCNTKVGSTVRMPWRARSERPFCSMSISQFAT